MSNQQLIAAYIAKNGVTKCPPAVAAGSTLNKLTRQAVNRKRQAWRKQAKRG